MGANEKHAATYHGGEYTSTTEAIRDQFIDRRGEPGNESWNEGAALRFDRWLETVRAEAEAEGMREAIKSVRWVYNLQCPVKPSDNYIHRAAQIAHKWWEKVLGGRLDELERRANQYKEEP